MLRLLRHYFYFVPAQLTADLEWIFARNREDTEQLHYKSVKIFFSNYS